MKDHLKTISVFTLPSLLVLVVFGSLAPRAANSPKQTSVQTHSPSEPAQALPPAAQHPQHRPDPTQRIVSLLENGDVLEGLGLISETLEKPSNEKLKGFLQTILRRKRKLGFHQNVDVVMQLALRTPQLSSMLKAKLLEEFYDSSKASSRLKGPLLSLKPQEPTLGMSIVNILHREGKESAARAHMGRLMAQLEQDPAKKVELFQIARSKR